MCVTLLFTCDILQSVQVWVDRWIARSVGLCANLIDLGIVNVVFFEV